MRVLRLATVLLLGAAILSSEAVGATSRFSASVTPVDAAAARTMTGRSWHEGCPVGLADLRIVRATTLGFDGRAHPGRIVVHRDVARQVVQVLRRLYETRFPIRRMVPIDAYGASDFRSIEADNTSAFNCRFVDGTTRWSEHAYGRAIDLNPIENPYITSAGTTSHPASAPYLDRSRALPGMAVEGSPVVEAFDAAGWGWGGRWSGAHDTQHFSASGR
jgi:hypothetical protein